MTVVDGRPNATDPSPGQASDARRLPAGGRVPWGTTVVLAALMAYVDGFVLTSVQGAVGAIERTGAPFATWLRSSTLMLPVFVLAVLGALTFARRRLGPALHRPRTVIAAALLVVAAGSLVGTAEVAVSAAYDYHLQSAALKAGAATHGHAHVHGAASAPAACSFCSDQEQTLATDARAAQYAARLILGANIVLVTWVTAMRGGRLYATRDRGSRSASPAMDAGSLPAMGTD